MKRIIFAAAAALALASAEALELEGFQFDDRTKLANVELAINGAGVRSKFGKRYVMALYLPAKASDAKVALATKGPKRIAIQLIKDVDGDTFAGAVAKGINNNTDEAGQAALKERVKQLAETVTALGEIKAKSSVVFDLIPEKGTVLTINGQQKGKEIAGEDFQLALLRVWLGDDPVQDDLKAALLGKAQ